VKKIVLWNSNYRKGLKIFYFFPPAAQDYTSIIVSRSNNGTVVQPQQPQPQSPPDVILQTLPDVMTSYFESPQQQQQQQQQRHNSNNNFSQQQQVVEPLTANFLFNGVKNNGLSIMGKDNTTELVNLADLESITDFLGVNQTNQNSQPQLQSIQAPSQLILDICGKPPVSSSSCSDFKAGNTLMDMFEPTKMDCTWESGSSSSDSGGSHFEFSCTQDVSDMLSDIGVNEPVDLGLDDIMVRI
jgi:hypothetical protein